MELDLSVMHQRVLRDMSEGMFILGMNGRVIEMNPAALSMLSLTEDEVVGMPFAATFFEYEENDDFCQTVLDAIYEARTLHCSVVPYFNGTDTRYIQMSTSYLWEEGQASGVIAVMADVSELLELRDELIRKNQQITALLDSMVKALARAIDERSHYNANHTRNMVRYGEAFLDWLDSTDSALRFSEDRRKAFLMSVWLHDVGKLAVPLRVMDKPTRLGPAMDTIRDRFRTIHLLDRIAALEGQFPLEEYQRREQERADALALIERSNSAGFLPDETFAQLDALSKRTYTEEDGEKRPWITEEERVCLAIRRGTLTDEERKVMQGHATVTGRILSTVSFPAEYADVPRWASSHHELLNGRGYPNGVKAEDIPMEVRLLTILDIFEALTAKDRPYKKAMPLEKALGILHSMVQEGSLDGELLALFEQSRAWEGIVDG